MNWHAVLGILSATALFIPIVLIIVLRLFKHTSFLALGVYYLLPGIYELGQQNILPLSKNISHYLGITNNLLDAPMMMTFLLFFSYSVRMSKKIKYGIFIFIVFEVVVLILFGMTVKAITVVLAPGILIILCLSFIMFLRQVRVTIMQQRGMGKSLMISSVLFAYTIYGLIYLFYYVLDTPYKTDALLVYYLASFLSSLLLSFGILINIKRIKKLNELKHTRKELASIYGETTTTIVAKTGSL